ncbi:MAG: winged helix-turn-helix domain-containing protein [Gammaproteobacteria bacterium]|nr:winged helix-turn-helix domain-containing protein [Gammaproteobacteria bacterium]
MAIVRTEKQNVFTGIITSKMRVQILMRLFLNPKNRAYLREMASEFDASPGQLREELGQLAEAGIVESERVGRQVYYHANEKHALFPELNSMVRKALGMDHILDSILQRLGDLEAAALIDDYAEGKDTGIIDLALLGDIDHANLADLTKKAENYLQRKIRVLVFDSGDRERYEATLTQRPALPVWER